MHDDSSPSEAGDDFGNANALPKGTRLSEFEIERVLGEGGFAIVYLAFDTSLHRHVALKEYLPAEFAFRQDENTIVLRSVQHQRTFEAGRKSFVQEARFLAQFEHPSLVKVHRVFESNGTAYMVQGYYPGQSLGAVLKTGRRYASEAELRPMVAALLAAVDLLHSRQCLHRDIAPDNIIIQPNGVPVLLDFGAARRIIGDMTQALTAVLKPSYAPIEQYTEDGGLAQGPWTDVYALAATLRMAIIGKPPPSSVGRTIKDAMVKLADDPPPNFDLTFLCGIDAGLALLPADRPQTIAEFRAAMGIEADDEVTAPPTRQTLRTEVRASAPIGQATVVTVPNTHAAVPAPPIRMEPVAPPPPRVTPPPPRRRLKRSDVMLAVIAAAAVGLMLVVPFAADWIWPSPAPMPRPPVPRENRAPTPAPSPSPPVAPVSTVAPPSIAAAEKASPAPAASRGPPPLASTTAPAPVSPPVAKDPKPAVPPEKPAAAPAPAAALPPAKFAVSTPEPAPPPPKQEPPPKPPPREAAPSPAASPSLIPLPAPPAATAPASPPREESLPKPAAVSPPPSTASLSPPEAPKARRALMRVSGEPPVYPREAIRAGIDSGRVVALVTVDSKGNVADIDIVRSEPPRIFDRAARAALEVWKFKPEGERYQGEVELRFNLKE